MSRKRIAVYAAISILPLIAALWIAGVDPNYLLGNYVTSTSGYVTGDLIQASAPIGGSVTQILTDVGEPVQTNQALAYLTALPSAGPVIRTAVPPVRAPGPGTIVHVSVLVGQSITAGQPVATIADLKSLWVIAAIDEGSFFQVRPGQRADVFVPALNQTFSGRVSQLLPDMQETTPRTGTAASSSTTHPNASVPIRIQFDYGDTLVYPGMSANVTIYVRS